MSIELKQAAQQALEALEFSETEPHRPQYEVEASAMRALRTAIQQAEAKTDEPVAALVRHRRIRTPAECAFDKKDHYSEWSDWEPCTLSYARAVTDPARDVGLLPLYEMLPLYTHPSPGVPDGLQWFTVDEHGLPEVGETVIGGLWYTDPWLKPDRATYFMWGQCSVIAEKHHDFKEGKRWLTFGPSHNQITHWARLTPPAMLTASPAQKVKV